MRLSKTSAYAALATAYLANQSRAGMVQARQVADYLSIPTDSALKILQVLARHGVIESQLGRSGGYRLAADPTQVTLLNIVEAIDGPITGDMPVTNQCEKIAGGLGLLQTICDQAAEKIRTELSRSTIADLAGCDRSHILLSLAKAT